MTARSVPGLGALLWLPHGIYCFPQPGELADAAGVSSTPPTGANERRAICGGRHA